MPGEPTNDHARLIDQAMEARGWIVNSYAQFENLLGDLLRRAQFQPEYFNIPESPHRTESRIKQVRSLLDRSGPLQPFASQIGDLLIRFENLELERLVLVHSYTELLISPDGPVFRFQRYVKTEKDKPPELRENLFTLARLLTIRQRFIDFARDALAAFYEVHRALGWAS